LPRGGEHRLCALANNHVLDWGRAGLLRTLDTLEHLQIRTVGAGRNLRQSIAPAALDIAGKGRVLIFSFGSVTSAIPREWAAARDAPGVNLLTDLSEADALRTADYIASVTQPGDLVVVSLHWGSNWGYEIPSEQRLFAHTLVDKANASIVYGHSSHHAKAIEIYRRRLILYGCGDFLTDYEGIGGYEEYRGDLALMYFADLEPATGDLAALEIVPLQIRKFRLIRPAKQDIDWMRHALDRESIAFGTGVTLKSPKHIAVLIESRPHPSTKVDRSAPG
jgi:poly-gamma-glutamate capsule biosynthesis protein CapA/YwtB (metallophosphatase superfamily)